MIYTKDEKVVDRALRGVYFGKYLQTRLDKFKFSSHIFQVKVIINNTFVRCLNVIGQFVKKITMDCFELTA